MSEHPQAKRANPMWWLAVILGVAACWAEIFRGAYGFLGVSEASIAGGLMMAALNPLVWLGVWAFFFRVRPLSQLAKCPYCGKWINLNIYSRIPALGKINCRECGKDFLKPPPIASPLFHAPR